MSYDPSAASAFYDAYGVREWTRFEDGRTPSTSLATHRHYLERFVRNGSRVADIGCGRGRFTLDLARLGASIVAADLSPGQRELHRRHTAEVEHAVERRVLADVLDLSAFDEGEFDVTVCFGGAVSYVLDQAPRAVSELARVTRAGGFVLVSVMALVGSAIHAFDAVLDVARTQGAQAVESVVRSGFLPEAYGGHLPMHLYRWRELAELLTGHGEIVAASATGLFGASAEQAELFERLEVELGSEPGAIDSGHHILAVVQV